MIRSYPIPPSQRHETLIASGGVNPELGESVAKSLGMELADVTLKRHGNGERYARFNESVRGKDVYILQSHAGIERDDPDTSYTVEEALNEQLFMVYAAAGSSARSVMAVAPYMIHSRGDRKSRGREVVPGPLVIQFFEVAGMKTRFSMMNVDPHSQQTPETLRTGSFDSLTAQPELREAMVESIGATALINSVVVSPDEGAMKNNVRHAKELTKLLRKITGRSDINIRAIYMDKERGYEDTTQITRAGDIYGIEGMICLSFDDLIASGQTVSTQADKLMSAGAAAVYFGATHPTFTHTTVDTLQKSKVDKFFIANTLPAIKDAKDRMSDRLVVVDSAPLISRGIYENIVAGSISDVFDDQNYK